MVFALKSHRQLTIFTLTVIIATLTLFSPRPALSQIPNRIPDPRFGAVESYYRPEDAREAGVGWDRMIFEWRDLQPNGPDDWETEHWETWLREAKKNGRLVAGLIKNAPHWATGSDILGDIPLGLDLPLDDPNNRWAAFIKKLVTYYSQKWNLHDWIIYNEPDIRPEDTNGAFFEFKGGVEDYFKMVKVAYLVAHKVDPKAVIHLAGQALWYDINGHRPLYLERFVKQAFADPDGKANKLFFDVLDVHLYDDTNFIWKMLWQLKSIPESYHFPKPIWIDEMNIRPTVDGKWALRGKNNPEDSDVTVNEQANFIVQSAAVALAADVDRIGYYRLFDNAYPTDNADLYESWGLIRGDGSRRPGYYALKTITHYFTDVKKAWRIRYHGVMLVLLIQPETTTYILWNTTIAPITVRIKAREDLLGTVLISPIGQQEPTIKSDVGDGVFQFDLAPCRGQCVVEGEPRILVQAGPPMNVWIVGSQEKLDRVN